jgi:hypothetical protein
MSAAYWTVAHSTIDYNKYGYGAFCIRGWENNSGYLFLLVISRLVCNLVFKTLKKF